MGILPIDVILVYSTNCGNVIGKMLTKQWNFRGIWYPIFSQSYLQWRFIGITWFIGCIGFVRNCVFVWFIPFVDVFILTIPHLLAIPNHIFVYSAIHKVVPV